MLAHLERLENDCKVNYADGSNQLIDLDNAAARKALLTPCSTGSCLADEQKAQYAALYPSVITYEQAQQKLYATQCEYPELAPVCRVVGDPYWKDGVTYSQAYYTALTTGGDFGDAAAKERANIADDSKLICQALQKTVPALYTQALKQVGGECAKGTEIKTLDQVILSLANADRQAARTAIQQILHS